MYFITHFLTNEILRDGKSIVLLLLQWFFNEHQNNKGILKMLSFHLQKECKGKYVECQVAHMEFSSTLRSESKKPILYCEGLLSWEVIVTSE